MTARGFPGTAAVETLVAVRRARDFIDRRYAEPIDLDAMAAAAGYSRFYFVRAFRAAYGETPGRYLSRRRVERAEELLRFANLTVTEVCYLVGFASLGSFSSLFTELVGLGPSEFQKRARKAGPPPIPGCYLLMTAGPPPRSKDRNPEEAAERPRDLASNPFRFSTAKEHDMITRLGVAGIYVTDYDQARDFFTEKLGFKVRADLKMENGYRWLTLYPPGSPQFQLSLTVPGPPSHDEETAAMLRTLLAKGALSAGAWNTDDCRATFEEYSARGVEFLQEPQERPYGVEAVFRDNSGNWFSLNELNAAAFDDEAMSAAYEPGDS